MKGIVCPKCRSCPQMFKKTKPSKPIILMGYYNIILHYGVKNFVTNCVKNGVDGLIVVDLQPEEDEELIENLKDSNIDLIRLIKQFSISLLIRFVKCASAEIFFTISLLPRLIKNS